MNINIVKKKGNLYTLSSKIDKVLEVYLSNDSLQYYLYSPENGTIKELYPQIPKDYHVTVSNCLYESDLVFFASRMRDGDEYIYTIYSCHGDDEPRKMCTFRESADFDENSVDITAFILSENHVLVQRTDWVKWDFEQYLGNLKFELTLYDAETGESFAVTEESYKNNGIKLIKRLDETDIMVKSGFNCLEDSRIPANSEKAALIEGVYFGSMELFIENLKSNSTMHDLNLLVSTYNDKYIVNSGYGDGLIFYTIVQADRKIAETYFCNIKTEEKISFRKEDPDLEDMNYSYVIDGIPYIRIASKKSVDFLNLKSADIDINFPDEEFVDVIGRLFVMKRVKYNHEHLRLYLYPKLKMVLDEKAKYVDSCKVNEDLYIYI